MKSHARLLLVFLVFTGAARAEVPSLIASGFDAYKASGSKGALATWLRGSPATAAIGAAGLPPDVGTGSENAEGYGPMESYEILAVYSPSTRLRRIYAVAYFPQGPLFCSFDLFKNSGSWTTYFLKFSISPDQVLPVELIEKTG
jgi:hypothetical protein